MIITIKNLQQQTFTLEFDVEKTVLELKEVIFQKRGEEYKIEKQKLIYAGIILENERKLASYNVDEKKFIVVMLKRDVGTTDNKLVNAESPKSNTEDTTDTQQVLEKKNSSEEISESSYADIDLTESNMQTQAESNLLMGDDYNRSVDYLIEMGYSREMVERAMAASYNNPDRAVEYLISGIPDVDEDVAGFGAEQEVRSSERSDNRPTEDNNTRDPFEFLRDQPQFLQMRSLVYQNPDLLHAVLQQIGQTNPALLQLISENQDAFLNMLNQPVEGHGHEQNSTSHTRSSPERRATISALSNLADYRIAERPTDPTGRRNANISRTINTASDRTINQNMSVNAGISGDSEGPAFIRLTQAEQEAIDRLKSMGFPEALVLQAYFACDKDEQLAANFLVSSAFED